MNRKRIFPIADYGLRILFSVLLVGASFQLLAQSTFAWRLRNDAPGGAMALALGLSALAGVLPLASGRRYLRAYVVCATVVTLLGAYWWTTIPWEETITETNFNLEQPPTLWDHLMAASPAFLAVAYAALSGWSALRADMLSRGVDRAQADQAAAASFLGGGVALVAATAAAFVFIALLAGGLAQPRMMLPLPSVVSAVLGVLVLGGALALLGRRWPRLRDLRRPSSRAEGPASPERSPAQKWPS